jgi:hypothetical protein
MQDMDGRWGLQRACAADADGVRELVGQGSLEIRRVGAVLKGRETGLPSLVVDDRGVEVEPVAAFLRDLMLCDLSPATCRSYAHDLLRWFR